MVGVWDCGEILTCPLSCLQYFKAARHTADNRDKQKVKPTSNPHALKQPSFTRSSPLNSVSSLDPPAAAASISRTGLFPGQAVDTLFHVFSFVKIFFF